MAKLRYKYVDLVRGEESRMTKARERGDKRLWNDKEIRIDLRRKVSVK